MKTYTPSNKNKADISRWVDRVVGDECVKEWGEGVRHRSWQTVKRAAPFTAGLYKASKHSSMERRHSLSLKSSLILSTAEQCLTGAYNHFKAQI